MSESAPIDPGPVDAERDEPSGDVGGALASLGARGLAAALRPLARLGEMAEDIREMTADVGRMAGNTDALPEVTETLNEIRAHTERMDREVAEMRAAVDELREMLEPMAAQLEGVTRITNRLPGGRRRRRAQAEADEALRAHDAE